ncbi:MAG: helix-turn-helix domain-containing protein [Pseudomonadales bacterium]|nr:helix-turn-helix domain-containing protein [Pseudomonadales bacterium]
MTESWQNDNESVDDATASSGQVDVDAAEMLRTAREKAGLSQKEVAERLYLTERFIRFIDEGAFDRITKPAFIKGYLRSYARLVNVSGDEVVDRYQRSLDEAEEAIELRSVTEESLGPNNFTGPVIQTGLAGLAGLLLFIGFVWWLVAGNSEDETELSTEDTLVVEEPVEPAPAREEPADKGDVMTPAGNDLAVADALTGQNVVAGKDTTVVEDTVGDEMRDEMPEAVETAVVEAETLAPGPDEPADEGRNVTIQRAVADAGNNRITVNAGGDDNIRMTFSDECWVEITDADDVSIYGDLNREGDELIVHGTAPFQVLLGRATSVTMQFNGEFIDLDSYMTTDQTARVRLKN